MEIKVETVAYNQNRYGKPWIAKVTYPSLSQKFEFGIWLGVDGEPGSLLIEAQPGDIIAHGQKDTRQAKYSKTIYNAVNNDGSLARLSGPAAAYDVWSASQSPSKEDLLREKHMLLERIDEINAALAEMEDN